LKSKLIDWLIALCQFLLLGIILISGYFEHLGFDRKAGFILRILSVVVLARGAVGLLIKCFNVGTKGFSIAGARKERKICK
jgi:hypothetical protein